MEIKNMTINLCFKMAQLIPLMRGGAGQPPPHTHLSLYKISEKLSIVKFSKSEGKC